MSSSSSPSLESPASLVRDPPLSGVLGGVPPGAFANEDNIRTYVGQLMSKSKVHGKTDVSYKHVRFVVGRVPGGAAAVMRSTCAADYARAQPIRLNPVAVNELTSLNRKYSNFTGAFERADMSAVIERLSRAVAFFSATGALTHNDILAGHVLNVTVLNSIDHPVAASMAQVFIPRFVDSAVTPNVFVAMVYAINGCGSGVVSDVIAVNANGVVILAQPAGAILAQACNDALRVLLCMYDQAGAGGVAAYALTRGVHAMLTVHGHTDEGSYIRRVMRRESFSPPYGGVYSAGALKYIGLPATNPNSFGSFVQWSDSIALKTAAAVAVCAPTDTRGTKVYPRILTSGIGPIVDAGISAVVVPGAQDAERLTERTANAANGFCLRYIDELTAIFMMRAAGDHSIAVAHLTGAFASLAGRDDAHLRTSAANPFFWVEPTTLYTTRNSTAANDAGYGVIVGTTEKRVEFAFENDARGLIRNDGGSVELAINHRTGRTNAMVLHFSQHRLNGLAHIVPLQFASENVSLIRARVGLAATTVAARRIALDDMARYLWTRGDCAIPAPHEFLYVGNMIAVRISTTVRDADGLEVPAHMYSSSELSMPRGLGPTVEFTATKPSAGRCGARNVLGAERVDGYHEALRALESSRNGYELGRMAGAAMLVASNTEPAMFEAAEGGQYVAAGIGMPVRGPDRIIDGRPIGPAVAPVHMLAAARPVEMRSQSGRIVAAPSPSPSSSSRQSSGPGPALFGGMASPSTGAQSQSSSSAAAYAVLDGIDTFGAASSSGSSSGPTFHDDLSSFGSGPLAGANNAQHAQPTGTAAGQPSQGAGAAVQPGSGSAGSA